MTTNKQAQAITHDNKSLTFWSITLALMLTLWTFSNASFAANSVNVDSSTGIAIEGYDPVAYFTQGKPVKGKSEFTVEHEGNKWLLSSAVHKKTFLENPSAYIPQYGGFCAYAASNNAIAGVDPRAWEVHNNKLYLNYSKRVNKIWLKKKVQRIVDADRNWPTLMKKAR